LTRLLGILSVLCFALAIWLSQGHFASSQDAAWSFEDSWAFWFCVLLLAGGAFLLAGAIGMFSKSWRLAGKAALATIPLVAIVGLILFKAQYGLREIHYLTLIGEDGPVEYATAIVLVLTAVLSIINMRLAFKRRLLIVGAFFAAFFAVSLFIALEEISYGQRLLDFATPAEIEAVNRQKEFNLHNITDFEWFTLRMAPVILASYGILGFLAHALLVKLIPSRLIAGQQTDLLFPQWYAASYFLPLGIYACTIFYAGENFVWQDQEPAELFMSFGFLLIAVHALPTIRRSVTCDPTSEQARPSDA
jgi:hypothetical protein